MRAHYTSLMLEFHPQNPWCKERTNSKSSLQKHAVLATLPNDKQTKFKRHRLYSGYFAGVDREQQIVIGAFTKQVGELAKYRTGSSSPSPKFIVPTGVVLPDKGLEHHAGSSAIMQGVLQSCRVFCTEQQSTRTEPANEWPSCTSQRRK